MLQQWACKSIHWNLWKDYQRLLKIYKLVIKMVSGVESEWY